MPKRQSLELRDALNEARSVLSFLGITFSIPTVEVGFPIRAAHIRELRAGVK